MQRDRLLREIRELQISFASKYGRPMTRDEIRTLEVAEKLAHNITESPATSFQAEWILERNRLADEPLLAIREQA